MIRMDERVKCRHMMLGSTSVDTLAKDHVGSFPRGDSRHMFDSWERMFWLPSEESVYGI